MKRITRIQNYLKLLATIAKCHAINFSNRHRQHLKERFVKFETVRGLFLVPAGMVLIYTTWYHFQFSIQAFFTAIGSYWVIDGLRKISVNRVKQHVAFQKEVKSAAMVDEIK